MYKVLVNDIPAIYKVGYFPRKFKYEKDAKECAQKAIDNGATMARVEYPNGGELDFRPKK